MFGIANQLLACTALCVGIDDLAARGEEEELRAHHTGVAPRVRRHDDDHRRHPERQRIFLLMLDKPATYTTGIVNVVVTSLLLVCMTLVIVGSAIR